MANTKLYSLFLVLLVFGAAVKSRVITEPETEQENRCGGALEADSGTLTFPATGQDIEPGRICIWTIHLQTTSTVRLNFSTLDIVGDDENCGDNAVRLYSLTNLIPADKSESYTYCNNNPPTGGYFFLSGNLVTVVYRSSEETTNTGAGFTLNWEGISFQPIPKTHESTYTSATSGVIRYPIDGEYAPNQINTWLIKPSDANPTLELQINVPYVNLEACSSALEDPCLCDALILYEITDTGILKENTRLCGNFTATAVEGLGPNFIVGFFTDHENFDGDGSGFELIYKPRPPTTTPQPTTTSPTDPSTTTPAPPVVNSTTKCGGALFGDEGLISYKANTSFDPYKKCFWTVRVPPSHSSIKFIMSPINLENTYDNIIFYGVHKTGLHQVADMTGEITNPSTIFVFSSVVIVEFFSDHSYTSQGFTLSWKAEGGSDESIQYYTDINVIATEETTLLRYPADGPYQDFELSTFVIARPADVDEYDYWRLNYTFTKVSFESWGGGPGCFDVLHVFATETNSNRKYLTRYTPEDGACTLSDVIGNYRYTDAIVVVFISDYSGRGEGFDLEWHLVRGEGKQDLINGSKGK